MLLASSTPLVASAPEIAADEVDAALFNRCRQGERAALQQFVRHYERRIFAFLSRALATRAQVDDLAQEVFIRAYQNIHKFDPRGSAQLSTWLLTLAYHVVIDARRRARLLPQSLASDATDRASTNPELEMWRRELNSAVARAAAELPADQRDAFILAEYHGLTVAEIASITGTLTATVKTRLFRARAHLRERLASVWEVAR